MRLFVGILLLSSFLLSSCVNKASSGSTNIQYPIKKRGEVLFLGNKGKHHDSGRYAPWLAISLFKEGVNLTYTVDLNDLNIENLSQYDGLIIYANHDTLSKSQENAMKEFVENGKGLIPLHSASGCFNISDKRGWLHRSVDVVLCIRCLVWPPQATEWTTRHREYNWPDTATINCIVDEGCDVVHVAHPVCKNDELMSIFQHRLSFSRAETVILNTWSPTQQLTCHILRVFYQPFSPTQVSLLSRDTTLNH